MADAYPLGAVVPLTFNVTDADGELSDASTAALTILLPNGSTQAVTLQHPSVGVYTCDYTSGLPGRHVATFVTTGTNAGSIQDVFDITAGSLAYVTTTDVTNYLRDSSGSWTSDQIADALAAEQAAQSAVCRLDPYTADLREALLRRVARNLAMRQLPLAVLQGDADAGSTVLPVRDPEIRRLEAPYRRRKVG